MDKQKLNIEDLGTIDYKGAWDYQENLLQKNVALKTAARKENQDYDPNTLHTTHRLLLCEHPPVYTLGKSGSMGNLIYSEKEMEEKGIQFIPTNRGGDITFHGEGQIVGYPIMDLEKLKPDIGWYLRNLEEVIILTLAEYDLSAGRSSGETGVWLDADKKGEERKICAIGVRCSRWITMHGFALNVNTSLDYYKGIIPCGITGKQVTSLEKETGKKMKMEEVKKNLVLNFKKVFDFSE